MLERIRSSSFIQVLAIAIFVIVIGSLAAFGWLIGSSKLLTVFSETATMKFNTALAFGLTGFSLLSFSRKGHFFQKFAICIIFALSTYTVLEYVFDLPFSIDNLIVQDTISSKLPGRMSLGTAICFFLVALSMSFSNYRAVKLKRRSIIFLSTILLICVFSIITFVLELPISVSVFFIDTMSLSTSTLFILVSLALYKKNNSYGLGRQYLKDLEGNRLMRFLLPFVIMIPLSLSYILLKLISSGKVNIELGIIIYTISFTLGGILYIAFLGNRLNKIDFKRKKLQEFFENSNRELSQFKYALDKSSLITITNANGTIMYANDKFCEISKYNREEIIGQTNEIVDAGYHSKSFFENLFKTIRSGEVWTGGIKSKAKDGSFYWVHTSIVPFKNSEGEVYQFLDIRQDITAEKTLSEQYENLKLKNQEIEQFSFIASHDLQEPLNTLKSVVALLTEEYSEKLGDDAKRYFGFISQTTTRMENLIKGLLDYSRLGNHKEIQLLDSQEMLTMVVAELSNSVKESNAVITFNELPELRVFGKEFKLLMLNLIENALKFTRQGVAPEIKISAMEKEAYWEFQISDNGIGIEEEYSQKVFAIFTRLNDREDFDGAGIGLAYCEKIVRLHAGTIWFDSEVGVGTTFYFTISKKLT